MLLSSFLFKAYDYLIFRAAYQYTERVNIHSCFGSIVLSCKPPCHTGNSSSNIQTTSNKWKPNHPANNPSKKVNTASTYILHYRRISSIQQIKCNVINANEISQKMRKYWLKREITVLDVLLRLNSFQRSTISSINSIIHLLIRNGLLTRNCNFWGTGEVWIMLFQAWVWKLVGNLWLSRYKKQRTGGVSLHPVLP